MILYIVIAVLAVMLASLVGVLFVSQTLGNWMQRNLRFLITFSLGVLVVVSYQLIREVFHDQTSTLLLLAWMAGGIVIVELASQLIPNAHHHHGMLEHDHAHSPLDARRMLLGDGIHNIGDGILITTAFLVSVPVGIATTAAIFIHELAQELSEFFIMREAGYTTRQALGWNFLLSSTIILGVILTLFVSLVEILEVPLLGFAAGSFIYIIVRDLLPHTIDSVKRHRKLPIHVLAGVAGVILMLSIGMLFPHDHEEEIMVSSDEQHYLQEVGLHQ